MLQKSEGTYSLSLISSSLYKVGSTVCVWLNVKSISYCNLSHI